MNNLPAAMPPSSLLTEPQVQAVLLAAEQRAADLINSLPTADPRAGITPGWRTSEFWCLVVFFLLALTTTLIGVLPAKYAVIAQAINVGLYQISRGLAKHGN